jgi:hypothetical protein
MTSDKLSSEELTGEELAALIKRVFAPGPDDQALAILVDLPDDALPDTPAWRARREMARRWWEALAAQREVVGLRPDLYLFQNARMNNADLPAAAQRHEGGALLASAAELDPSRATPMDEVFAGHSIVLAPTQLSATAPLKLAARQTRAFRAATMPGFSPAMIPALRLDYAEINRRCGRLKELLDATESAAFHFAVQGGGEHRLLLDLRHRAATTSGGVFPQNGFAGNLPSGETYIVPYEGELPDDATRSVGELPVQFGDEVVVYRVEGNRAVEVLAPDGSAAAAREARRLAEEPAYGNMAELGLGVLADFGLQPIGELLLDEKLGLHIAFGRSDHFGGQVGAADFSSPEAVVHVDRVYLPSMQPRITVKQVDLQCPEEGVELICDDRYVVEL